MVAQTTNLENIKVSDTETIDKIKEKLGGKELSSELVKLILDAKNSLKNSKDKVQSAYRFAIEKEKLSKEEAKTIVAQLLGVSLRTTTSYIPDDLKDEKYVTAGAQRKALKVDTDTGTPGIHNEEGKYGTTQELEAQEAPEQMLKRIMKKFKQDVEVTVLGRTFSIECEADPVERTINGKYNEKELARILKGRPTN